MRERLLERFISYVKIDTMADRHGTVCPTSQGQLTLGRQLVDELKDLGLTDAKMDENGYVMATLPANTDKNIPTVGFLAHIDTSPDFSAVNVNPQVVAYEGGDIVLNQAQNIILSPSQFPELPGYKGQTLITTDGTTLLGADNKAGIAEIMAALDHLTQNPQIKHGKIRVAFTPDEEIGRGPHRFDVAEFGADFAYTIDGGPLGELQYESFNAAEVKLTFKGVNTHPGTAKDKMVNSNVIAMDFHRELPVDEVPEKTDGYEGFTHLIEITGTVEKTEVYYIIRDFDKEKFQAKKDFMKALIEKYQGLYGASNVIWEINDQYLNMAEKINEMFEIVELAKKAMTNLGIEPKIGGIRGGTDGSQLSYMGLPTPNIFTGGENFHGKFEYISLDSMIKATETIVEMVKLLEQKA